MHVRSDLFNIRRRVGRKAEKGTKDIESRDFVI